MLQENLLDKTYIAKAFAIKKVDNNKIKELSSPLDIFLVIPITKRNFYGEEIIHGYTEIITEKPIIYTKNYKNSFITENYDYLTKEKYNEGDLYWEVINKIPAKNILNETFMDNYLLKTIDDINYELYTVRSYAKKISDIYNKVHIKKKEK